MENSVKKEVSENALNISTNPDADQNMEKSLSTEEFSSSRTDPNANAGLVYFKLISEKMKTEVENLKIKLNQITATNKTQKQNILDMENQKQTLVIGFQDHLRNFNQKIKYEKKLDQAIENIVPFLQQMVQLKSDITDLKTSGHHTRNYIIRKYQEICPNFENMFQLCENQISQLHFKEESMKKEKTQWIEYDDCSQELYYTTKTIEKEIDHLKWTIKDSSTKKNLSEQEYQIIKTQFKLKQEQIQAHVKNHSIDFWKIFEVFRGESCDFNETIKTEMTNLFNNYDKLIKKLNKKIFINNETLKKVAECEKAMEEPQTENMDKSLEQSNLQSKILDLDNEIQSITSSIKQLKTKENELKLLQVKTSDVKNRIETKKQNVIRKLDELKPLQQKCFILDKNLTEEIKKTEILNVNIMEIIEKRDAMKKNAIKLHLHVQEKENDRLKKNSCFIDALNVENSSIDQDFLQTYLSIEYERNAICEFIESRLNDLADEVCELQIKIKNLEKTTNDNERESLELDKSLLDNEFLLKKAIEDVKVNENSIQMLKQNVYQGRCVTQQELNKKLKVLKNAVKSEKFAVDKLKEELEKRYISVGNKTPTLKKGNIDGKRSIYSEKTPVSVKNSKKSCEDFASPSIDKYSFK